MPDPSPASIDFFISYTGTDKAWAEWVAWQLEHRGYKTLIQACHETEGSSFTDLHLHGNRSAGSSTDLKFAHNTLRRVRMKNGRADRTMMPSLPRSPTESLWAAPP